MDIGTAMSVVQTLLAALQCSQHKDFCSKTNISSQIEQLQVIVKRIQGVLEDAESKQSLSKHEEVYIEELKEAVYEADDLFDEFVTLAHQKKLTKGVKNRLLSFFTKLKGDYRISQKIEKIKQKLDGVACSNQLVCFRHDPEPLKKRSRETCSYVHAVDIIGREEDLDKIVDVLLNSDGKRPVSFLSIVGIGGLGKTALAQLVFNDPRVTSAFSLKLWTCVSDQDQNEFDEREILRKILEAAIADKCREVTKERLQSQLRKLLEGKKFLLVLDDIWTENREQWRKLVDFLIGGQKGSWILVTTRSKRTTTIIGDGLNYELKGLSKQNSWQLFERAAFGSEVENRPEDLVKIGQKVVERCANIPLAIRVVGSLLYGQDRCKWLSFQEFPLIKFEENKNDIMPILKLSYDHLEYPLKSCFGYCAIFPKDYVIKKKTLLRLWMAQGYISSEYQRSLKDVAEEYFLRLLQRCFFQDVKENAYGEIYSCKLHDLMHDVAQEVVGKEICEGDFVSDVVDKKTRHISTTRGEFKRYIFNKTCIRSYLRICPYYVEDGKLDQLSLNMLLANWKYLRVLDLGRLGIKSLSGSIGELLHLRYLNLSCNHNLEMLPKNITKLYNLQTLDIHNCSSLKELPKDMSKFVNLRDLDIWGCNMLNFMPEGIGNLSYLEEISMFIVGEANSDSRKPSNGLEDLKAMNNLKGYLNIRIFFFEKNGNEERDGGNKVGCLSNKAHLTSVELSFSKEKCDGRIENDEAIIEELQPHSNIKSLQVWYYEGIKMPNWAREDTLANLVKIKIGECPNLQSLGLLGILHHLKVIQLYTLLNLEWLSENKNATESISEDVEKFTIFPSLEILRWRELPNLKRLWKEIGMGDHHQLLMLPKLKKLTLHNCQNLVAILECLTLEDLDLENFNNKLVIKLTGKEFEEEPTSKIFKLNKIKVDNLAWLNSQHSNIEAFQHLESLELTSDKEIESLGEGQEVFRSCSSSLLSLKIKSCSKLRSVYGGLQHLTTLETLMIVNCHKVNVEHAMEIPQSLTP